MGLAAVMCHTILNITVTSKIPSPKFDLHIPWNIFLSELYSLVVLCKLRLLGYFY